jgi:hypothetical protein
MALAADIPVYRALHATAGAFFLPQEHDASGDFAFGLSAAWVGPCVEPLRGVRGALGVCAKFAAGPIHSVVYKYVPTDLTGAKPWVGGSLAGEGRLRLVGPLAVGAGVELVVPFTEDSFSIVGQSSPIFGQPGAGVMGYVGVGVTIP